MEIKQCIFTKNDCYKSNRKIKPKGIVVHSTGANNPNLRRYVQPDDGLLGKNNNNNDWNRPGVSKCVHGFLGKDKNGDVQFYQTLPFDIACWGVGRGSKGSYNYSPAYIQFEICEDALTDEKYFNEAFGLAIEVCAYLCNTYGLPVENVVSHHEAHLKGYGSNHGDCDHWLKKFGRNMDWFRDSVRAKLGQAPAPAPTPTPTGTPVNYMVKINTPELNVRENPDANAKITTTVKKGEVFTIVEEYKGWGKLKSGAGWISLNYTKPYKKAKTKKSVDTIARECIAGKWGNGITRNVRLTLAGYNYKEVQKKVNQLLKK
jgi:N-acetylmuramoyl-L-alanine amidase